MEIETVNHMLKMFGNKSQLFKALQYWPSFKLTEYYLWNNLLSKSSRNTSNELTAKYM